MNSELPPRRRSVPGLWLLVLLCPLGSPASERVLAPDPAPPGLSEARFRLFLPDSAGVQLSPLRAVVAVSDYQAAAQVYTDPAWRAFAKRERCAMLLHALGQDHPRFKLARGEPAVAALEAALAHFARAGAPPELARIPWILVGLSQSAWQAHSWANLRPARTLAALLFHASTSPHGPEDYTHPGGQDVPMLLAMAGDETFPIEMLAFARTGAMRGRPWTYFLQVGVPHARLGPPDFPLRWLTAVMALRLGPDGALRRLDPAAGWGGDYAEYSPRPDHRQPARAEIFPRAGAPGRRPEGQLWLPDEAVARAWRSALLDPAAAPATPVSP